MSPSLITARSSRPWLAAVLMLAVLLTATPARCHPLCSTARRTAAILFDPAFRWLCQLESMLRLPGSTGGDAARPSPPSAPRPSGALAHAASAGPATGRSAPAADDSGGGINGGTDPNGH